MSNTPKIILLASIWIQLLTKHLHKVEGAISSKIMAYLPAILWALVILYLSTGPGVNLPSSWGDIFQLDKLAHLVVYGILTALFLWGKLKKEGSNNLVQSDWLIAILVSSFYGIGMEILQYAFFPNRYFEYLDIFANIIGSFLGVLIFKHYFQKIK